MAKKKQTTGEVRRGRRARGISPMPPVTIAALPEEFMAIAIYGDGSMSLGFQKMVKRLAELDPEFEAMFDQGMRIRNLVTAIMQARGDEVTEREIYRYASKNYYDLFEETSLSAG